MMPANFIRQAFVPLTLAALIAALIALRGLVPGVERPPAMLLINLEAPLNVAIRSIAEWAQPFFRFLSWFFAIPIDWLRSGLGSLPWFVFVTLTALIAHAAGGIRLAMFAASALLYVAVTGYWTQTMMTLAVVGVAIPISISAGLVIGIIAHRAIGIRRVVEPVLDLMQTVPTFAYLIPMLVLFGVGPVVGMLASAIYAIPPMVRSVILGFERIPGEVIEAGLMGGSTRRQMLWLVELPTALPVILLGANQTVMAVLSMVVIASILGGFPDIGWEVYNTMKKAQFGESILAGFVIVLIAMVLDRITQGFALRTEQGLFSGRDLLAGIAILAAASAAAWSLPALNVYPDQWVVNPAAEINSALDWFTRNFFWLTKAVKESVVLYVLLPIKLGLLTVASPFTWGFTVTPSAALIYWFATSGLTLAACHLAGVGGAVAIAVAACIYFFGLIGLPWLAVASFVLAAAWSAGGIRLVFPSLAGILFIAFAGAWDQAMTSVSLMLAGVLIAFVLGIAIGVMAALDDHISAILRPINDTLQTMPSFVFLIPAIMVFLVGEFTALVAIVLYAVVPSIRYTEHGLRGTPGDVIEAARASGATSAQLFWHVRLPLALPEILLGLNQTIMLGLAMVVVAALVGAQGLGADIMIALTWMDVGKGFVFGLSVAIIAMIADRIAQGWSRKLKTALGLSS
jgi:glycine betaine/proline transport system permease protein